MLQLKEEVGPVLARGLTETAVAKPQNPREYLGLWLLHYLKQQDIDEARKEEYERQEREKEQWTKAKLFKQSQAADSIQRQWKQHQHAQAERKRREGELTLRMQEAERDMEDGQEFSEDTLMVEEFDGQTEAEKDSELEKKKADLGYQKSLALLGKLDKAAIGDIKKMKKPTPQVFAVLRCCFFLLFNKQPQLVSTWMQVRMLLKPSPFLEAISSFTPCGPGQKKRKFVRVKRILSLFKEEEEEIKRAAISVYLLYQWLSQACELRTKHESDVALKRANGREVDDDEDPEEEEENENEVKDPDEEKARLIEVEEARLKAEEDNGEEEGEAQEEEEES